MRSTRLIIVGLIIGLPWTRVLAEETPVSASTAPVVQVSTPSVTSLPRRSDLNEMHGKFQSKGDDETLRVLVDGGFNVGFTYDKNTVIVDGGHPIQIDDLNYGDDLIVRYKGKELYAVEVDRMTKTP